MTPPATLIRPRRNSSPPPCEAERPERWEEASRRSLARAREFSWDESARQLVDVAQVMARAQEAAPLEDIHAVEAELDGFAVRFAASRPSRPQDPGDGRRLGVGEEQQGADVLPATAG